MFLGHTKDVGSGMHCWKNSTDVAKNKKLVKDPT